MASKSARTDPIQACLRTANRLSRVVGAGGPNAAYKPENRPLVATFFDQLRKAVNTEPPLLRAARDPMEIPTHYQIRKGVKR